MNTVGWGEGGGKSTFTIHEAPGRTLLPSYLILLAASTGFFFLPVCNPGCQGHRSPGEVKDLHLTTLLTSWAPFLISLPLL